jgi:hypothetical protein
MWDALGGNLMFSGIILLIQIPLGRLHRAQHAQERLLGSFCLV